MWFWLWAPYHVVFTPVCFVGASLNNWKISQPIMILYKNAFSTDWATLNAFIHSPLFIKTLFHSIEKQLHITRVLNGEVLKSPKAWNKLCGFDKKNLAKITLFELYRIMKLLKLPCIKLIAFNVVSCLVSWYFLFSYMSTKLISYIFNQKVFSYKEVQKSATDTYNTTLWHPIFHMEDFWEW